MDAVLLLRQTKKKIRFQLLYPGRTHTHQRRIATNCRCWLVLGWGAPARECVGGLVSGRGFFHELIKHPITLLCLNWWIRIIAVRSLSCCCGSRLVCVSIIMSPVVRLFLWWLQFDFAPDYLSQIPGPFQLYTRKIYILCAGTVVRVEVSGSVPAPGMRYPWACLYRPALWNKLLQ